MAKSLDASAMMSALQQAPIAKPKPTPAAAAKKAAPARGRPINLYLHPDDTERIRKLAAYLSSQGKRVSDSQVVKASLRLATSDKALLKAFEEVVANDQRFTKTKA